VPSSVDLINDNHPPSGIGETAIVAAGAAIGNAVRAAMGYRVQQLPLNPLMLPKHLKGSK
jgi:isoquinoline 1-oxidoreductase subunit beta